MTARSDFAFFHPLRVRWSECDAQGIVFNVNYLHYYDIAVWEWTRALGFATWDQAPEYLTLRVESDFRASALFDDELEIGMRAARLGVKSMEMAGAVFRGEALLNEARLFYCHVKKGTRETSPMPDDLKARIAQFEKLPPARK
jgi:acyl-CoA thioester hydrolase